MGNQLGCKKKKSSYSMKSIQDLKSLIYSTQVVKLQCRTWSKVSHNLHNYDDKSIITQNLVANGPGYLIRKGESLYWRDYANFIYIQPDEKIILRILEQSSNLSLYAPTKSNSLKSQSIENCSSPQILLSESQVLTDSDNFENLQQFKQPVVFNKIWISINKFQFFEKGYRVNIGDILKFGRIKLKIREINIQKQQQNRVKVSLSNQGICKICLSSSHETQLISPCQCSGTMKYVHVDCLFKWITMKAQSKKGSKYFQVYMWKDMRCELCKNHYKNLFEDDDFNFVDYLSPQQGPYMVFEVQQKKRLSHSIGIYVLQFFEKHTLTIGRGTQNQIQLRDISVSRFHAEVTLSNNEICLRDLGSKFGTLALMQEDLQISTMAKNSKIQVGRSAIQISVKNNNQSYLY